MLLVYFVHSYLIFPFVRSAPSVALNISLKSINGHQEDSFYDVTKSWLFDKSWTSGLSWWLINMILSQVQLAMLWRSSIDNLFTKYHHLVSHDSLRCFSTFYNSLRSNLHRALEEAFNFTFAIVIVTKTISILARFTSQLRLKIC